MKLWQEVRNRWRMVTLFVVCWLAFTLAALKWLSLLEFSAFQAVSLMVVGALVGRWRSSGRISRGMVVGALLGGLSSLTIDGYEVAGWLNGGRVFTIQPGQVAEFVALFAAVGALLGLAGALIHAFLAGSRAQRMQAAGL